MSVNNWGELLMVAKLLMVSSKPLQCKDKIAKDQSINWVCLDLGTRLLWRADQTNGLGPALGSMRAEACSPKEDPVGFAVKKAKSPTARRGCRLEHVVCSSCKCSANCARRLHWSVS